MSTHNAVADFLSRLPWEVAGAIIVLVLLAGLAVTLLALMWADSVDSRRSRSHVTLSNQPWLSHEDDGQVYEIPLYPPPPVHVTRFGIHRAHTLKGVERERGCPVCIDLDLFTLQRDADAAKAMYARVRMKGQGQQDPPETGH